MVFTDKWGLQKEPFVLDSTDDLVNYYNYMWEETYFGDYDIALKLSPNSPKYKNRSRYMNNTLRQMDQIRKNKLCVKK